MVIDLTDTDAESIGEDGEVPKGETETGLCQRESAVSRDHPLEPRPVQLESAEAQQPQPDATSLASGYLVHWTKILHCCF